MLAGDYKNAGSYLIEADNILRMLKRSTMKTCNMSKLFGLIALASFRQGNMYNARLYLNKAKQFLSHVLGKKEEEKEHYADDSMFLVYFVSGLMKEKEKMLIMTIPLINLVILRKVDSQALLMIIT